MSTDPDYDDADDQELEEDSNSDDGEILNDASTNSPARATIGATDDFDENDFDDDFDDDFEEEMSDDYQFEHALIEGEVDESADDDEEIGELDDDGEAADAEEEIEEFEDED